LSRFLPAVPIGTTKKNGYSTPKREPLVIIRLVAICGSWMIFKFSLNQSPQRAVWVFGSGIVRQVYDYLLLANWYFDPLARRAAEKTLNEMLSSGEPDELAEREWW
jgi:hypothetical protein